MSQLKIYLQRDFAAGVYLSDILPPSPPPPMTHCVQLNQREVKRDNSSQSWVENTNMLTVYLRSENSDKHLPQSPFTGQFF